MAAGDLLAGGVALGELDDEPDLVLATAFERVVPGSGAAEPAQLAEGLLVDGAPLARIHSLDGAALGAHAPQEHARESDHK